MHRLARVSRGLGHCASWRALVADAAGTQAGAPAAFADASRRAQSATVLLRGRSAHNASVAAHEHSGVVCACVLERLPIVLPPQPAWEAEYQDWRYEKLRATFKQYPKELTEPKTVEEDETKQSWTAALPSQAPEHHKSPERKPEDFVYLLVRNAGGAWQFPQAAHEAGETVRKVAERALAQAATGLDVYFIGNAPAAHHAPPQGPALFFLRASYLGGSVQLPSGSGLTDWAWVTKGELREYVGEELHAVLDKAL